MEYKKKRTTIQRADWWVPEVDDGAGEWVKEVNR